MHNKTVLISGAGIAGPTLAYWLSAAGFEPTIIERAPKLRTAGYVVDFWGLGYDIAEQMDLSEIFDRVGYHMREVRVVGDRGQRLAGFDVQLFDKLTGGRFVTIGRSELSRLLFEASAGKIETIFDSEIVGLQDRSDGVVVQFQHGPERRFDLVVGADGLHSQVRRLAFDPQDNFERELGYWVAAFEVAGYRPRDPDVYVMYGKPGRLLGRFTLHGDRTMFLFLFTAGEKPLPDTLDLQKSALREQFGGDLWECPQILGQLDHVEELYLDRVSQIRMGAWSKGRVALIGDAAFCVSLAAGQGSALAMVSAYVLAGELARTGGAHEAAFQSYEKILRTYIETKQNGAKRLASALAPRTPGGLWFRNRVMNAFSIPGVARLTAGREIMDSLLLPRYDWPTGLRGAGDRRKPRRVNPAGLAAGPSDEPR